MEPTSSISHKVSPIENRIGFRLSPLGNVEATFINVIPTSKEDLGKQMDTAEWLERFWLKKNLKVYTNMRAVVQAGSVGPAVVPVGHVIDPFESEWRLQTFWGTTFEEALAFFRRSGSIVHSLFNRRKVMPLTDEGKKSGVSESSGKVDRTLKDTSKGAECESLGMREVPRGYLPHLAHTVTSSPSFKIFSLLVLILSCVNLALDPPKSPSVVSRGYLSTCDILFGAVFSLELLLSFIKHWGKEAGWRGIVLDPWFYLDVTIVIISCLSIPKLFNSGQRALRSARALRLLKLIRRVPSLRLVFTSMAFSIPASKDILFVLFLVTVIFSLLGIGSFHSIMSSCNDPSIKYVEECTGNFTLFGDRCSLLPTDAEADACMASPTGVSFPRLYAADPQHFNTLSNALLYVFELITGENWPSFFMKTVDSVYSSRIPKINVATFVNQSSGEITYSSLTPVRSTWTPMSGDASAFILPAIYFSLTNIVLNMVIVELFSSLTIDMYMGLRDQLAGIHLLTDAQRLWVQNMRILLLSQPEHLPVPYFPPWAPSFLRRIIQYTYTLVIHPYYELFSDVLSFGGVLSLMSLNDGASSAKLINNINKFFVSVYALDIILRVMGIGWEQYIRSWWNRLDAFLFITSLVELIFEWTPLSLVFRMINYFRLFRLLKCGTNNSVASRKRDNAHGILAVPRYVHRILFTITLSLPGLGNALMIYGVNMYIWSIVGMNLFGGIRHGSLGFFGSGSFETFPDAFMMMIRCLTGENFNGIMRELLVSPPYCTSSGNSETDTCANEAGAVFFFVFFYAFTAYIIMSIVLAIIVDAFELSQDAPVDEKTRSPRVSYEHALSFNTLWKFYDRKGTKYLNAWSIEHIICELSFPLGLRHDPRLEELLRNYAPLITTPSSPMERLLSSIEEARLNTTNKKNHKKRRRFLLAYAKEVFNSLHLKSDPRGLYHSHAVLQGLLQRCASGAQFHSNIKLEPLGLLFIRHDGSFSPQVDPKPLIDAAAKIIRFFKAVHHKRQSASLSPRNEGS